MRCHKSRFVAVISGLLLSVAAATAAYADDTEIFFNQNGADVPANVMFILDTSGSMNSLVTTQKKYDPSLTYKADKCGTAFDANSYYFSSKGIPACGSAQKIAKTLFKCASMLTPLKASGFATDSFAQWGPTVNNKTTGAGTAASPTVVVSTTTYGWKRSLSADQHHGLRGVQGRCRRRRRRRRQDEALRLDRHLLDPDHDHHAAGHHGGQFRRGDRLPRTPDRRVGCDQEHLQGRAAAVAAAPPAPDRARSTTSITSTTSTIRPRATSASKMSIMQDAVEALMNSLTGINVGVMRYDVKGNGGMVLEPVANIDTGTQRSDIISLVNSWAPSGNTPLSETYYEAYLYFSGNAVLYGKNSYSSTCKSWNAVDGTCSGANSFAAPSVAASRVGGTISGTNYDSPADYSCRQNFIVYLTDGLPNEKGQSDAAIQALNQKKKCDTTTFAGATGGKCLATLADYMYNNDMRPDITKVQNVTSYFIGFGTDFCQRRRTHCRLQLPAGGGHGRRWRGLHGHRPHRAQQRLQRHPGRRDQDQHDLQRAVGDGQRLQPHPDPG